jgi:pantetheine-phosphate adenylyltransferase
MARTGFYPGSFDPVTYGHLDIIARSARLVDKLVLGVGIHHGKQSMLPAETRIALLEKVTRPIAEHTGIKITVATFDGLAVDAARQHHAGIMIRGIRDSTDFDYEVQLGQMNAALAPDIETVFLAASPATRMIASSLVKQIAKMGGDTTPFIPKEAQEVMAAALVKPSH